MTCKCPTGHWERPRCPDAGTTHGGTSNDIQVSGRSHWVDVDGVYWDGVDNEWTSHSPSWLENHSENKRNQKSLHIHYYYSRAHLKIPVVMWQKRLAWEENPWIILKSEPSSFQYLGLKTHNLFFSLLFTSCSLSGGGILTELWNYPMRESTEHCN